MVIKKNEYAQVNLVTDSNGNRFIEKIRFHKQPAVQLGFEYASGGIEIFESILALLDIPHPRIITCSQNDNSATLVMEYIDGINCGEVPTAEHLYAAAVKLGTIYRKSTANMACLDNDVRAKYTLTKEKVTELVRVIRERFPLPTLDQLIDYIYEKYQNYPEFVNHHDIQFKNFIYDGDLHLIDWDNVKIHPFFSDLSSLIGCAHEVGADVNEIKRRYSEFAQIGLVSDEDIRIGAIIGAILGLFELLIFDCPVEWLEESYHKLQNLIRDAAI